MSRREWLDMLGAFALAFLALASLWLMAVMATGFGL